MEEKIILNEEIEKGDFKRGGEASSNLKNILRKLGVKPAIIRKIAIVAYELEMNIIIHSEGGRIKAAVSQGGITLYASDRGPGIDDVDLAFKPGFSTASQEIREMGFGAGMGLTNVKNSADRLFVDSGPGRGTDIVVEINFEEGGDG